MKSTRTARQLMHIYSQNTIYIYTQKPECSFKIGTALKSHNDSAEDDGENAKGPGDDSVLATFHVLEHFVRRLFRCNGGS